MNIEPVSWVTAGSRGQPASLPPSRTLSAAGSKPQAFKDSFQVPTPWTLSMIRYVVLQVSIPGSVSLRMKLEPRLHTRSTRDLIPILDGSASTSFNTSAVDREIAFGKRQSCARVRSCPPLVRTLSTSPQDVTDEPDNVTSLSTLNPLLGASTSPFSSADGVLQKLPSPDLSLRRVRTATSTVQPFVAASKLFSSVLPETSTFSSLAPTLSDRPSKFLFPAFCNVTDAWPHRRSRKSPARWELDINRYHRAITEPGTVRHSVVFLQIP